MATLFNTKISATYEGLLKTIDNAAISATLKELTDGSGNQSGLYLNTAGDFKVTNVLEWGSLKDTGTGVTITRYVTSTDGLENFDNNTSLPTSAAVKLYVDTKFATSDTLQEVLSFGNTTSGNDIAVSSGDNITLTDFSKILIGASNDLQIYHSNPTGSFVQHDGTGNLHLSTSNDFILENGDRTKTIIDSTKDAEVNLYFNDAKKLETTNTGISVTGIISNLTNPIDAQDAATKSYVDGLDAGSDLDITDGTNTGDVNLNTQTLSILGTTNEIETVVSGQGVTIGLPSSINTDLVGNVTGNLIGNVTGDLTGTASKLEVNNTAVDQNERVLLSTSTGSQDVFNDAGLLFNPVTHLLTVDGSGTFTGDLTVTGNITGVGGSFLPLAGGTMTGTGGVKFPNNFFLNIGANNDFQLHHNGLNSYITDSGTGSLILSSNDIRIEKYGGDAIASFIADGEVELYYNNAKKFATTNTGISVTGNVVPTGNVHIQDAGQLILGASLNGRIYHDGSNFYANNSTGQLNIDQSAVTESIVFKTSDANALDTTALIINRGGDLITGRDVTIAGDLTVNGTTTTVNSQTLSVDDPLISLAINNAANSLDIGYYGKYNDGTTRYLGLYNDASDSNKFKLFKGTTVEPTTTVNIGAAGYAAADLELANLVATGNVTGTTFIGNLTGDVTGNLQGDVTGDVTGNLTGTVNSASVLANGVTATTQTAGDNSTKVATTAYANAAASAIPIGDYLPLSAGSGFPLTGALTGTSATFTGNVNLSANKHILIGTDSGDAFNGDSVIRIQDTSNAFVQMKVGSTSSSGFLVGNTTDDFLGGFLYSNSTESLTFNTANSLALTITGAGNATFAGNVTTSGDITIDNASGDPFLKFKTTAQEYVIRIDQSDSEKLQIRDTTNNATRLTIDNTGNVGIGTDSPITKLTVENGIARTSTTKTYSTFVHSDDSDDYRFGLATALKGGATGADRYVSLEAASYQVSTDTFSGGLDLLLNPNGGNVGIGTTSPSTKLHVESSENANWTTTFKNTLNSNSHSVYTSYNNSSTNTRYGVYIQGAGTTASDYHLLINDKFAVLGNGNVGIGTASPSAPLNVVAESSADQALVQKWQYQPSVDDYSLSLKQTVTSGVVRWTFDQKNNGTDYPNVMTLDRGQLLVGKTSTGNAGAGLILYEDATDGGVIKYTRQNTTVMQAHLVFFTNAGGVVGSVQTTNSSTSYVTSSDYRLKEDLQDFAGLDMVSKIPVYNYKWKSDESRSYGVMAHELQEVLPDAVSGEKDAEEMQGVDYSKIVPLLIKSIQELTAKVERLEAK